MNSKNLSLELRSLRHTIDDLLIAQEKLESDHLHLQLENEQLQHRLTNHRQVIRNLRREISKQQATEAHLHAALAAALQLHGDADE